MRYESAIDAPMFSRGESLTHSMAALPTILRRVRRIHFDHLATGAFSLVRQDRNELTPPGVTNALGEMAILYQPFDVHIFNGDHLKLAHEFERRLVVKVCAAAANPLMFLLKQLDCLTPAAASLIRAARHSALGSLQFPLRLAQEFGILDDLSCRKRDETLNPDINANRGTGLWEESGLILFNDKDHIPAIRLTLDRTGFDRSLDGTGEANAARSNLGEMEFSALIDNLDDQ